MPSGLLDVTANIAEKRQYHHGRGRADRRGRLARSDQGHEGPRDLEQRDRRHRGQKIQRNLGDLAKEAGTTTAGKIAIVNNLWGEFKEKIGGAIVGTDEFKNSSTGLRVRRWST